MQECERQRHQVFDHWSLPELIDFDCLKGDVVTLQEPDDRRQMRASTDEDGYLLIARTPYKIDHARGLVIFIEEGVYVDRSVFSSCARNAGRIGHSSRLDGIRRWKNPRKGSI